MSNRENWLNLTQETAIEHELPICDPHHHIWNHPKNRYLIDEFAAEIGAHRIIKTVFIECLQFYSSDGPEKFKPVGETKFVASVAGPTKTDSGTTDIAAGIVGFADLTLGLDVQAVLSAHLETTPRFRGIRHSTAWHQSEQIHNAHTNPPSNILADKTFLNGLSCVQQSGLSFDVWLYHTQIPELTALAEKMPDLTIILNHVGGPLGVAQYANQREEVFKLWKDNMRSLAKHQNINIKLGGMTMAISGFGWHKREVPASSIEIAQAIAPYFQTCIELFGVERCMFESNFPVDRAACSYTVLWNAFKRISQEYSNTERAALFHDTAVKVYRI